jgi:hypothetical protein
VLVGLLAALLAKIDPLNDAPTFARIVVLLVLMALALSGVEWSRRARDGVLVLATMAGGLALGLLAITATPHVVHLARTHLDPLMLAVIAATIGGGIGRRMARA